MDLFLDFENQIHHFSQLGPVFIAGDTNARTSDRLDYIANDRLHGDLANLLSNLFAYASDATLCQRVNPDNTTNDYGYKLLSLCQSSGLRILNGRHPENKSNDFTFAGSRGLSVVDYLITSAEMFQFIPSFVVSDFNTYSDHAPLIFDLTCVLGGQSSVQNRDVGDINIRTFRWNSELAPLAREALIVNADSLTRCAHAVSTCELSQDGIDSAVDGLCTFLTDTLAPFCEVTRSAGDHSRTTSDTHIPTRSKSNHSSIDRVHRPWFTDELITLRRIYMSALSTFNRDKTPVNLESLRACKRSYKVLEARLKRQFLRTEGDMLESLRKSNPKAFYKRFSKRRSRSGCTGDRLSSFHEHFRDLASSATVDEHTDDIYNDDDNEPIFHELDCEISELEIVNGIKRLKKGKAHSLDLILNDMLIEFKDVLMPCLVDLFNKILSSGYFPSSWSSAVIVPVFKKGDRAEPNNYRGISLISCLCKLFTSIINERLLNWSKENDIITDAQFGFRAKMGTSEAIFALHSVIHKTLSSKRRLYCCFIDYKKAFDSIDRKLLWYKLSKYGIRGKLLSVIRNMYSNVKSCVSIDGACVEKVNSAFYQS